MTVNLAYRRVARCEKNSGIFGSPAASSGGRWLRCLLGGATDSSGVLRRDGLDDGCGFLGCVDRPLEPEKDVPPADDYHRVASASEQRGEGFAEEPIAVVLEPVDLDPILVEVLEP